MSMYQTVTKTNQKQSTDSLMLLLTCSDLETVKSERKAKCRLKVFGYVKGLFIFIRMIYFDKEV